MRASRGNSTARLAASYFCGTYGTYGRKNPTGCRCHRVNHELIERLVLDYVADTSPKVAQLLAATKTGDLEAAKPLLDSITDTKGQYLGLQCDLLLMVDLNVSNTEREVGRARGLSLSELYGLVYERVRPQIAVQIDEKEGALDRMLDGYADLTGPVRGRAKAKMDDLQREIDLLRRDATDWRQPYEEIEKELAARKVAFERATKILSNGAAGRQKTEVLSSIVEQIVCHFEHSAKSEKSKGKSQLAKVEIIPICGDAVCFTDGNKLARD